MTAGTARSEAVVSLFYSFVHHCVAHPLLWLADVLRQVLVVIAAIVALHEMTARQLECPVCPVDGSCARCGGHAPCVCA